MKLHFILLLLSLATIMNAQEQATEEDTSYWSNALKIGTNFTQTSFSDNWTGGGNNAIALNGFLLGKAYFTKDKITWNNEADFQYGMVKNEDRSARKTVDKIMLDSKFGYRVSKKWNTYASLNYLSQFAKGYKYPEVNGVEVRRQISDFNAPAFITSSWGLEYCPIDELWVRIGPFSPRITMVTDTTLYRNIPENYGVPIGETVRYEWLAFQATAQYENEIVENVNLKAKYQFFANYEEFEPKKFDHRFDLFITAKVYKFLNVNFTAAFIYDIDQAEKIQSSQQLGVGLLFTIGSFERFE
ncbi:MAG: DUF3078 domain-containing protein [Bacteroidota bacterium]